MATNQVIRMNHQDEVDADGSVQPLPETIVNEKQNDTNAQTLRAEP